MKKAKIKDDGSAARAEAARKAAEQAAETLRQNMAADLTTENVGQVIAGGTAEVIDEGTALKKKKGQVPLSSQLGINV